MGIELTDAQVAAFIEYGALLIAANRHVNLTAIEDPDEVVDRHFLDSLAVLRQPAVRRLAEAAGGGPRLIDVGTGAGFPGLPIKIARPELEVTLVESTGKKAAFVRAVIDRLGLAGALVLTGRAEDLGRRPDLREAFDVAVARALAPLPVLLELTLPFVRVGGCAILHKTWPWQAELDAAEPARGRLGGAWEDLPEEPPELESRRTLLSVAKVAPTPGAYPRRAGIPAKRPIGPA